MRTTSGPEYETNCTDMRTAQKFRVRLSKAIGYTEAVWRARHTWSMDAAMRHAHWSSTCTMYSAGHVHWSGMDRWSTLTVFM